MGPVVILAQKFRPILVSVLVSGLNQKPGFGCTLRYLENFKCYFKKNLDPLCSLEIPPEAKNLCQQMSFSNNLRIYATIDTGIVYVSGLSKFLFTNTN